MSTAPNGFTKKPGQGYLFYARSDDDARTKKERKAAELGAQVPQVHVWQGYLVLPGGKEVQLRATASTRDKVWRVNAHEMGGTWKFISGFEAPPFGEAKFTDGKLNIDNRSYTIRIIRDPEQGYMLVRMPQVMNAVEARNAVV